MTKLQNEYMRMHPSRWCVEEHGKYSVEYVAWLEAEIERLRCEVVTADKRGYELAVWYKYHCSRNNIQFMGTYEEARDIVKKEAQDRGENK